MFPKSLIILTFQTAAMGLWWQKLQLLCRGLHRSEVVVLAGRQTQGTVQVSGALTNIVPEYTSEIW